MTNIFNKISKFVIPPAKIGGLQITNSSLRFMQFKKNSKTGDLSADSASIRLPPNMVVDGRIKDRANFVKALKDLHSQITPKRKKQINVVLTIPAGDVYVEVFNLPELEGKNVVEAASLNMQAISPNPIEQSYYSWMKVGESKGEDSKIEILGSFALKEVIDEMVSVLEEANFAVSAIEFSSLSLKRILVDMGVVKKDNPYLILKLTAEGLIFMIIRNGHLHFNYFQSWDKVSEEGEITLQQAFSIMERESQRVLNYYSSHYGDKINKIVLITSVFSDEIAQFLKGNYKDFEISVLRSDKDNLHGVRGAALRGLLDRHEDKDINLMSGSMIGAFMRDRIMHLVSLWRNIALTASIFVLIVFGLSFMFISAQEDAMREAQLQTPQMDNIAEFNMFREQYSGLNSLMSSLLELRQRDNSFASFMDKINSATGNNITISRISINSANGAVSLNGESSSQSFIIEFRNRLANTQGITNVDMPLSAVISQPDGTWRFSITLTALRIE